jgi:hypothetical protein
MAMIDGVFYLDSSAEPREPQVRGDATLTIFQGIHVTCVRCEVQR